MNRCLNRHLDVLWLIPVLILAAFLRTQHLAEVSYWFDESFCLKMAEFPLFDLLERACNDPHPPLFYLLLKAWIGIFGASVVSVRMLSVTCGIFTVLGVFLFVRESSRLGCEGPPPRSAVFTALLAASFVALSPFHIKWSQLVRMYSLGTALAAFSSFFLMRALRHSSVWSSDWSLFTITAALMIYTHYFGLFTVVSELIFACGYCFLDRTSTPPLSAWLRVRPVSISALGIYLAGLPWLIPFLDHRQLVNEHFRIPPLTLDMASATLFTAFDLELLLPFSSDAGMVVMQTCFITVVLTALSRRPGDVYVALAATFPIVAAVTVSLLMRHIFVQRYFLFVQMFLLIAVAILVGRIPWKPLRFALSLSLVAVMVSQTTQQYQKRERDGRLPGMTGTMAYYDSVRNSNAPLVICNPMLYLPAIFHTQNRVSIYASGSTGQYPFFQGTAVMRDDEYLSSEELRACHAQQIWTLDAERWFNSTWMVPVPHGWIEISQKRFPEFNSELVLRQYQRNNL